MSDDVPASIRELERQLGVGILVQDVTTGPPVKIQALVMIDDSTIDLTATGATEPEAWQDLIERVISTRNREGPRYLGA